MPLTLIITCCSICHVRVVGRPLYPAFDMEILEPSEKILLRYYPEFLSSITQDSSLNEVSHANHLEEVLWERIGLLEDLLPAIQHGPLNPNVWEEDDDAEIDGPLNPNVWEEDDDADMDGPLNPIVWEEDDDVAIDGGLL